MNSFLIELAQIKEVIDSVPNVIVRCSLKAGGIQTLRIPSLLSVAHLQQARVQWFISGQIPLKILHCLIFHFFM